jgi:hypothetical protein
LFRAANSFASLTTAPSFSNFFWDLVITCCATGGDWVKTAHQYSQPEYHSSLTMEKSYSSLKVLLKVFKFSAVSKVSSTRSVGMTFLYPGPALSTSRGFLEDPALSLGGGCRTPASTKVVNTLRPDPGSRPRADKRLPVPSVGAASGASTCSPPPALASSCRSSGGGKSTSVASTSGASSGGAGSSGADGSEAAAAGAGSAPEGSVQIDGSGAAVAAPGSS